MKNSILTLFVLTLFVNIAPGQSPEGDFAKAETRRAPEQHFANFSRFHNDNGLVYWQNIYTCSGMAKDSIRALILTIKKDLRYTLLDNGGDELIFNIEDMVEREDGQRYKGKITIQLKDEKYRLTFSSIEIPGLNPQSCLDGQNKYFRNLRFPYLLELDGKFLATFDFKNHSAKTSLTKDW